LARRQLLLLLPPRLLRLLLTLFNVVLVKLAVVAARR
jgi:hypothetical protein